MDRLLSGMAVNSLTKNGICHSYECSAIFKLVNSTNSAVFANNVNLVAKMRIFYYFTMLAIVEALSYFSLNSQLYFRIPKIRFSFFLVSNKFSAGKGEDE